MFVCKSCHEKDNPAIKCGKGVDDHAPKIFGPCSICGEYRPIVFCIAYPFRDVLPKIKQLGGTTNGGTE